MVVLPSDFAVMSHVLFSLFDTQLLKIAAVQRWWPVKIVGDKVDEWCGPPELDGHLKKCL